MREDEVHWNGDIGNDLRWFVVFEGHMETLQLIIGNIRSKGYRMGRQKKMQKGLITLHFFERLWPK